MVSEFHGNGSRERTQAHDGLDQSALLEVLDARKAAEVDWVQVSAGDGADTCGIMPGHTLWCCSWNYDGQLGIGTSAEDAYDTPQQVT